MAIIAELPDGTELEFPDGTPNDVVSAAAKKYIGGSSPQPVKQETWQDIAKDHVLADPTKGKVPSTLTFMKASFVKDPNTKARLYAEDLYPNDPEAQKNNVRVLGDRVAINQQGIWIDPEKSSDFETTMQKMSRLAGTNAKPAAQMGAETALAWQSGGTSLIPSMLRMGLAGAGTELASDIYATFLGQDSDPMRMAADAAIKGGLDAATTGVMSRLVPAVANSGKIEELGMIKDKFAAKELVDNAYKHKIGLTIPEIVQDPNLTADQRYVQQLTGASEQFVPFFEKRKTQLRDAMANILDSIAPKTEPVAVGRTVNTAAKGVVDDLVKGVKGETQAAFSGVDKDAPVDLRHIFYLIDDIKTDPELSNAGAKLVDSARSALSSASGGAPRDSVGALSGALSHIDAMIERPDLFGNAADKKAFSALSKIRGEIKATLDQVGPGYKEAMAVAGQGRGILKENIDETLLGSLVKPENEMEMISVLRNMFNPDHSGQMVQDAIRQMEKKEPGVGKLLLRYWLEKPWNKMKMTQDNVASFAEKHALTPEAEGVMRSLSDTDVVDDFIKFAKTAHTAAEGKYKGSMTHANAANSAKFGSPIDMTWLSNRSGYRQMQMLNKWRLLLADSDRLAKRWLPPDGAPRSWQDIEGLMPINPSVQKLLSGAGSGGSGLMQELLREE